MVAIQSVEGDICFTKLFLLKMGCEISGPGVLLYRFLLYLRSRAGQANKQMGQGLNRLLHSTGARPDPP